MCGDGANDCGALKAAHVGISLSDAESSVASPFTAKEQNISCVPKIIREGRAALVTSFGVFKIMVCYSLTELVSVLILYNIDANLSSQEFLFIDLALILNFAAFFGLTKAFSTLSPIPPPCSLMAMVPIASILCFVAVSAFFQVLGNLWMQTYSWFTPFMYDGISQQFLCYENYAVFCVSMFQYITMVVVFSKGKPYREPLYTNLLFSFSLAATTMICIYITLSPHQLLAALLELKIPPVEGRVVIIIVGFLSFVCSFLAESFLVDCFLEKWILGRRQNWRRSKTDYSNNTDWMKLITKYPNFKYISENRHSIHGHNNTVFVGSTDAVSSKC